MKLSVTGKLIAAISVSTTSEIVLCKSVVVSDISSGELFDARKVAIDGEFLAIHELAAKTQLIDGNGYSHQMTYAMLRDTSSANFKKLEELDYELTLKLSAESLENLSS